MCGIIRPPFRTVSFTLTIASTMDWYHSHHEGSSVPAASTYRPQIPDARHESSHDGFETHHWTNYDSNGGAYYMAQHLAPPAYLTEANLRTTSQDQIDCNGHSYTCDSNYTLPPPVRNASSSKRPEIVLSSSSSYYNGCYVLSAGKFLDLQRKNEYFCLACGRHESASTLFPHLVAVHGISIETPRLRLITSKASQRTVSGPPDCPPTLVLWQDGKKDGEEHRQQHRFGAWDENEDCLPTELALL
ncbi:unnamed protein product [Zymoseptoria tritici ST99CH_3D1]|nr:unnamed protein product [Zymoseptoria tritici ST99CH_3D1]